MHVMLDIETLGNGPDACVASIGYVTFDPETFEVRTEELLYPHLSHQLLSLRRSVNPETQEWWSKQAARHVLADQVLAEARSAGDCCDKLKKVLDEADAVWANGPDFDCVIMASLFKNFNLSWPFRKNRCLRTIKSLPLPKTYVKPTRLGTHHDALDDANYQVMELAAAVKALGLRL